MISINMGLMKKIITQQNVNLTFFFFFLNNSPTAALNVNYADLFYAVTVSFFSVLLFKNDPQFTRLGQQESRVQRVAFPLQQITFLHR